MIRNIKRTDNQSFSLLSNLFIREYMPFAPDEYVKVYLCGLSLIGGEYEISEIARILGVEEATVYEAFKYWQAQGIVNLIENEPPDVEYLTVRPAASVIKKFNKEKYSGFNTQLHAMLPGRNFLPNEYNEFYTVIEAMHIEPEAFLTIIAYCIRLKGEDIGINYIITVARNLASEGYKTFERVSEKLSELDFYDNDLISVLKALGSKKRPDHEDKQMFIKWTKTMGFTIAVIMGVAKQTKKGGMVKLDSLLTKYYENRLFSLEEIETYKQKREKLYDLTKRINKIIGVYYEQLDYIIETYTTKWLGYGFDEETLITVADYCFKRNIRTLEGLDATISKFYRQGLVNLDSIGRFMSEAINVDTKIKRLLENCGTERNVTSWDRDYFRTWTYTWKVDDALIDYAATLAKGKSNPISYMNSIIANFRALGIKTPEEAAKHNYNQENSDSKEIASISRSYTAEELNAMFDALNPEDM